MSLAERFIPASIRGMFGGGGAPEEVGQPEPPPLSTQLDIDKDELERIRLRIDSDYELALDDHNIRLRRCAQQEELWRKKPGMPGGETGESNFRVPICTALIFAKHAREIDAMFGPKASVSATPRGPSDTKSAKKVSIAMSWQVFDNMKCIKPVALWALRRLKHGRSFAFMPWESRFYTKYINGERTRVKYQSSPMIYPLGNDEIMLPADVEGCDTVQDARWVMRRYKTTPTEMLQRESVPGQPQNEEGDWYQGITDNFDRIVRLGREGIHRYQMSNEDQSKVVADRDEGVMRDMSSSVREYVIVEEHYIRWRMEAGGTGSDNNDDELLESAEPTEIDMGEEGATEPALAPGTFKDEQGVIREMLETDLVVRYIRDLHLIVGIQRLAELYPDTPNKRPILEMSLLNDGQYWCQGLIELTEEIEQEMSILANKLIEAVGMSIAPPIFVEPTVGENFMNRKYGPYDLIPTANAAGVQQMRINPQIESFAQLWLLFQQIYEQVTGISQGVFGRAMDQPNAPRTLGGQRLVAAAGDVRLALDMRMLAEDLTRVLEWIWDLWRMMGSEQEFYRVAEGDAPRGTFVAGDVTEGFAALSAKEREASYDFSFQLADDMQLREGKKQEILLVMQVLAGLPIIATNPAAQYRLAVEFCEVFNIDFTEIMDEPPPLFSPRLPSLEWTLLLQGEDIQVHPADDDAAHIEDHENRVTAMSMAPVEDQDWDAILAMREHVIQQRQQLLAKQQAQEVMAGLQQMIAMAGGALPGQDGGDQGQQQGLPPGNPLTQGMQGAGQAGMGGLGGGPTIGGGMGGGINGMGPVGG